MPIDTTEYYASTVRRTLSGDYLRRGDVADADCVIAAAFGERNDGTMGTSNEALAKFIAALPSSLPHILQTEISEALDAINDAQHDTETHIIGTARDITRRLDTLEFLEQAKVIMDENGYACTLLVAHPNHLPWVDYICAQSDIQTVTLDGLQDIPFDPLSSQAWTRSLADWQTEVRGRETAGDTRRELS